MIMSSTFRKQFQRVKQNFDQNLGRAEKSEVLNEEEQNLERRVELLKNICTSLSKKLQLCLRNAGQGTDTEKRMKKIPESGFSRSLIECSVQLEQQTTSGQIFQTCGDAEGRLAQEILHYEIEMETRVMKTVQTMLETDFPTIQKLKKQLNTRTLDMDASKARYSSVMKQVQSYAIPQSKVEEVKNELEDNISKVDQTKDQLSIEMYNFVSKETELNQSLLDLVHIQADYHRQSLAILERMIPVMQESFDFAPIKPVFSQLLDEHLDLRPGRQISIVIEDCVSTLVEFGLEEEGLFRLAGSSSKIKKLKAAFNANIACGSVISTEEEIDVHVVASILKLYLRELPEPLLCSKLYSDWILCVKEQIDAKKIPMLQEVIKKMPKPYQINLRYLIRFFAKLAEYSDINKMTPSNIGLVIGPNLLWLSGDQGPNMLTTGLLSNLAESLIQHALILFPGDIDFSYGAGRISHESSANTETGNYSILQAFNPPDLIPPAKFKEAPKEATGDAYVENYQSNTLKKASSKKHPAPSPPVIPSSEIQENSKIVNQTIATTIPTAVLITPNAVSIATNKSIPENNKSSFISKDNTGSANNVVAPSISTMPINKPNLENQKPSFNAKDGAPIAYMAPITNPTKPVEHIKSNVQAKEVTEVRTSFKSSQDSLDVVVPHSHSSPKVIEKPRIAPPERPTLPPPEKRKKYRLRL